MKKAETLGDVYTHTHIVSLRNKTKRIIKKTYAT
jgi:hypothetical protein